MDTMIIMAERQDNGKYIMTADNGELPQEGNEHNSKQSVYKDCKAMYEGATWQGRKVHSGYRIVID
jgi:hypothetical protein